MALGFVKRNLSGIMPLYVSESDEFQILSNRASLAAAIASQSSKPVIDPIFAAQLLGVGWPYSCNTLFKTVACVPQGSEIQVTSQGISTRSPTQEIWYDETLRTTFHSNPKRYWDDAFDQLVGGVKALGHLETSIPIRLFLSGGKDSRVLLGLCLAAGLLDRVEMKVTGPPYSHDVIVANKIARHYGHDLSHRDDVFSTMDYGAQLDGHLFLTEARKSPFDLHLTSENYGVASLIGHEAGLRVVGPDCHQPTDELAMRSWLERRLQDFDGAGVLEPATIEHNREQLAAWQAAAIESGTAIADLPARFQMDCRTRHYLAASKLADSMSSGFRAPLKIPVPSLDRL